tara:strand:+ start:152 stop:835 length:684 start_codon:yes stop_codon:yes gene_type:complete
VVQVKLVDVPRFELGASSMPRKRASKLRHTPRELATCDGHLSGTGWSIFMVSPRDSTGGAPEIPDGLLEKLADELEGMEAPFVEHLGRDLVLEWLPEEEDRLGLTRFECDHHEIYRRRRLGVPPGPVTIALNRILVDDEALYRHTLAHELLHAAGLLDHDGAHSEIVRRTAPAPKLRDSPVLMGLREKVLEGLPEEQWICGKCGHAWERRRVTRPTRCPKCASRFED